MSGRRAILLVAAREIRERLRSRAFLASTLVMLLLVGASTALNGVASKTTTYHVAVTAPPPAGLGAALDRAAKPLDAKVDLRVLRSPQAARAALRADDVDAVLALGSDRLVFGGDVDTRLAAIADGAVRSVRRHLPPAPELRTVTVGPSEGTITDAEALVAIGGSMLLLMSLAIYGQWVVSGVVEEKNSRVVEVLLSALQPRHLLAGKVIGIGLLGFAQLALVAGLAAILLAAGAFDAPKALGGSLALVIPWFALGFALYAVAYATAGALASRQQNADTVAQPVTYTLLVAWLATYVALAADASGVASTALTLFPLTAPLALPARSVVVGVPLWQHAVAVLLVLACIYALVRFAGRVYARGLLHAGPGLSARAAWRLGHER